MNSINYKKFKLTKFKIPNSKSMTYLMLTLVSKRPFWNSRDLRSSCARCIAIPNKLRKLTFKTGYHPGVNRLDYNLSWTLTYLYKSGMVDQLSYAKYQITSIGKKALKVCDNYLELNSFISEHKPKKESASTKNNNIQISNIYDRIDLDFHILHKELKKELLTSILNKNPYFFEKLVVVLLSRMGYKGTDGLAYQTKKSNDGGIDGVIKKDPLGTSTIYVQAKRYRKSDKVTKNEIKNFYTSVKDRHSFRGVFITTSSFNRGAISEAKRHSIILIDGNKLTKFMIKYNVGIRVSKTYRIADFDKDFFS